MRSGNKKDYLWGVKLQIKEEEEGGNQRIKGSVKITV